MSENEMPQEATSKESSSQVYELGYLVIPTISEEDLPGEIGKIKGLVDKVAPITIAEEYPKMIPLAYDMEKRFEEGIKTFSSGYFGWIKFEGDRQAINSLKKEMDEQKTILRFMIIKTVRENTIRQKQIPRSSVRREEKPEGPKEEMDVEAVDKEIEALVS